MTTPQIWRWHITLADSEPPIWRRFQVSNQITLADLHTVVQAVMGWQNAHWHQFKVSSDRESLPYQPVPAADQAAMQVTLAALNLQPGSRLSYTYDCSDGWLHILELEAVLSPSQDERSPYCLEGQRACPPEKSGGVWGYEELLEQLADPEDPDYEALLMWVGLDFDPEAFDPQAVNQRLQRLQLS